jgi:3-dehydroquinate synthase
MNSIQDFSSKLSLVSVSSEKKLNQNDKSMIPQSLLDSWNSLPANIRSALINNSGDLNKTDHTALNSDLSSSSRTSEESSDDSNSFEEICEVCPDTGSKTLLRPLERAPSNVYSFDKEHIDTQTNVQKVGNRTITTMTKTVSTGRGWRNVFSLPISYDIDIVAHGTLLDPSNPQLLHATGVPSEDYKRRFAVIDNAVEALYGDAIRNYFSSKGIELSTVIINGGEADKRPDAVDKILDALCVYKLRRREPFLAIGGGVVLDIAGMAACLYRRGVPFVRVPTTLLAIVDASVGVKNGIDYCCCVTDETYKNRVGSFYAPSSCLLDKAFITSQDCRNISNGFGEILKLALVRSVDLFELLEAHGKALIQSKFASTASVPDGASDRIIDLSIQIMLEELGPNLWETKLDRCVDYGHTFSKLLEMVPGADIMHGEAVNVDGFFCVIISYIRGYIDMDTVKRIFNCMKSLSLPTNSDNLNSELAWQSCKDAIEHRNGEMRIPLILEIGDSICVNDITQEELDAALEMMTQFDH